MFVHKTCVLILAGFLGGGVYASETYNSPHELDSIGMMQEVFVTAPRYENQDDAWAGLVEGVTVEAQRLSTRSGEPAAAAGSKTNASHNAGFDSKCCGSIVSLLLPLTLTLATISVLYMSVNAYLIAEEARHERTKNRSKEA